ncbi:MAG TPA: pentapeptide repeat-containing protein, partial [Polyangia bacterium]|nr:pentapeptide repeat-containing protein [Polyangia bacterium]
AGAKVDGALLKDATFTNTNLYGVDTSKAKDFALPANAFVVGPCIKKLAQLGTKAKGLDSAIRLDLAQGCVTLTLKVRTPVAGLSTLTDYTWSPEGVPGMKAGSSSVSEWGSKGTSIPTAFEALAGRFLKGRLRPDTLKVAGKGSPISGKDLKDLFLGAWREALGSDAAEAADAAAGKVAPTARALLDELRGDDGVQKWNAYSIGDRTKAGGFRGADLANAKLAGVGFRELDFQKAKFDGADLSGADLERSKLAGASFNRAMLEGAKLGLAVLRGASFRGARLAQADLDGLDLRKVDFTDADLAGAMLEGVIFDETTILPAGFAAPPEMVWKGKGADPRVKAAPAAAPVAYKTLDADAFMASLTARTDASRMEKTLKMLKADRFKLFVEVNDDRLAGVVKSQTDRDLVYACSIAADGAYACCTQNLNPCGGLRGALCKHLLVLVIGLAKGGGIEPGRADGWISAGLGRAPSLDKDAMARILLRYKGAEAGEVDWRPMETVPEDYYAM